MAERPLSYTLPADLPEDWQPGQTVAPDGASVGLTAQHGYNYQSKQINDAQRALNTINESFDTLSEDAVTVPGGGRMTMAESLGKAPFEIRVTPEEDAATAAGEVTYDNAQTGMAAQNVQEAVDELFTSVSDGKALVASAITDMGVKTPQDAAFQTLAANIRSIRTGIDESKLKWGGPSLMTNYETVSTSITFTGVPDFKLAIIVGQDIYYAENNVDSSKQYIIYWVFSKNDKWGWKQAQRPKANGGTGLLEYPSYTESNGTITFQAGSGFCFAGRYALRCIVSE